MSDSSASASRPLKVAIYADGANVAEMVKAYKTGTVPGFTTNPTLMAKAGVTDYRAFGKEVLAAIPDRSISFEVFADDFPTMAAQARELASWGKNVAVKIPIVNTKGESALPLIKELSHEGMSLNVTAVMTLEQTKGVIEAAKNGVPLILSIFAGRIADTGRDPVPLMKEAVRLAAVKPSIQVLWASPREVLNAYQADECGVHIITMTPDLIAKLKLQGKDLDEYSRETSLMFHTDAQKAGLSL